MIVVAVAGPPVEIRYRPSYGEIASEDILCQYRLTESQMDQSREGSDYVNRQIALIEAHKSLSRLSRVVDNWNSFGSERPSAESIRKATTIAETLINFGLIPDGIVPSAEGGVAICFVRSGKYADVECFNTGEILGVRYKDRDTPVVWAVEDNAHGSDATAGLLSACLCS